MRIQTRYFDEIEIGEQEIIHFQSGIPGFVDEKQFVLLPLGENTPYTILQSVQTVELAFVMTTPFFFFPEYEFKIPDPVVEALELKSETDVTVFSILNLKQPFEKSTANLRAPILIHAKIQLGKQLVLNDGDYPIQAPLGLQAQIRQEG